MIQTLRLSTNVPQKDPEQTQRASKYASLQPWKPADRFGKTVLLALRPVSTSLVGKGRVKPGSTNLN